MKRLATLALCGGMAAAAGAAPQTAGAPVPPPAAPGLVALPAPPVVDAHLAELGRQLFFDNRLSGDWSRACASCHLPARGWADGEALSRGYLGTQYYRNAPGLVNAVFHRRLGWDGALSEGGPGAGALAEAARGMVGTAHFMNADARLVEERLRQVPEYVRRWRAISGEAAGPDAAGAFAAIGAFVATLVSAPAPLDRYLGGQRDALDANQKAGLALFVGKAGCVRCHDGALASDGGFHRLGVPEHPDVLANPLRSITMLRAYARAGVPDYMSARTDLGRYAVTRREEDRGRFATPSLRNLRDTAPYMHSGVFARLEDVVEFYDRGGGPGSELRPLGLDAREKRQLVAFLLSMSGDPVRVETPEPPDFEVRNIAAAPQHRAAAEPPAAIGSGAKAAVAAGSTMDAAATGATAAPADAAPADAAPYPPLASLPPVQAPADNPATPQKIALGRLLYFDGRLSGDGSTPCVSCHFPQLGWAEGGRLSRGYPGTKQWRNVPSVLNAAYARHLAWDGSAPNLEAHAPGAAQNPVEGNGDAAMMEMRLRHVPEYVERFRAVFGTEWPRLADAWRAIAAFERTAVSDAARVPFDRYLAGERSALSAQALRGRALFEGRAGCIRCHNGALATDQQFYATGVPEADAFRSSALHQITRRWHQARSGAPEAGEEALLRDPGRYYATRDPRDIGKFRVPGLRELKYTAPYMHNGAFATLAEVVDFYDRGGGSVPNKTPLLQPLGLSAEDKQALVAFLLALSMDRPLLVEAPALPAYAPLK